MCNEIYVKNYNFYEHMCDMMSQDDILELTSKHTNIMPHNKEILSLKNCILRDIKIPDNLKKLYISNCYEYKKNFYYYIHQFFVSLDNYVPIFKKITDFFTKKIKLINITN